jgi:dTDP-4-dehydrorhamnose reductase
MRILVMGVGGQVGGALVRALEGQARIIGTDRTQLDLSQTAQIPEVLIEIEPDLIINAAAYTAVDRAEDESALAFRVNGEAPGVVARWAADRAVPLIHFSTDYVFDGSGTRAWREDDLTDPLSVYGVSKLAGENAIRAEGGSHLIIRTQWVYAATGANFVRTIARLAKERAELRIVSDQFGAPTSARLIADTVATMIRPHSVPLVRRFSDAGGIVNVAASGETTWHGFAVAIAAGLTSRGATLAVERILPIATSEYRTQAKRPANSRLDLSRLRELFGIDTPDWKEALAIELDQLAVELSRPSPAPEPA